MSDWLEDDLAAGHLQQPAKLGESRIVHSAACHHLLAKLAIFDEVSVGHVGDHARHAAWIVYARPVWPWCANSGPRWTRIDTRAAGIVRAGDAWSSRAARTTLTPRASWTSRTAGIRRIAHAITAADTDVDVDIGQLGAADLCADIGIDAASATNSRIGPDIGHAVAAADCRAGICVDAASTADAGDRTAANADASIGIDAAAAATDGCADTHAAAVDAYAYTEPAIAVSNIDSHRGRADRQHHGATSQCSGEFPETRHGFSPFGCIGCCAIVSGLHQRLRIFTATGFTKKLYVFTELANIET